MGKTITPAVVKQITRNLREFGYSSLTEEEVQEQVDKVLKDEPTNIIGMMAQGMLKENGYI